MRTPTLILWAALALWVPAATPAEPAPSSAGSALVRDSGTDGAFHELDLDNVKVQWFSKDEEDLPAWINARFQVGPLGGVEGRVIETALDADGTDDDGDPNGFDTKVFDTDDGSLRDVQVGPDSCGFATVYPDRSAGRVVYRLSRAGSPGSWVLGAAQKSSSGLYIGRNRFPLSDSLDHGVLTVSPDPDADSGSDPDQL